MKSIQVPDYAAIDFETKLRHPSGAPDALARSLNRVYQLIAHALHGLPHVDWRIDDDKKLGSATVNEPCGLERFALGFVVYAEERGRKGTLALFKDPHLAAKYFVWQVSKGQRQIDWSLFLDQEP